MSTQNAHLFLVHATMAVLLVLPNTEAKHSYNAIFSIGDSLADTGNFKYSGISPDYSRTLPCGQTYFGKGSGRFCDGRIMLDFIAQDFNLPLVKPYLEGGSAEDFKHGANFAVAGATALGSSYYEEQGINVTWTKYSLDIQIKLFKELLALLSSNSSCPSSTDSSKILSKSLVLLGEIGGNDYIYLLILGKSPSDIKSNTVPVVINAISSATKTVIGLGAKTIVIPGVTPFGCVAIFLTIFPSNNTQDYDPKTGCIKWLNEFSMYHNELLQQELAHLRHQYPDVTISYADYYEASYNVYSNYKNLGFDTELVACCGGNGPYNWNFTAQCGQPNINLCSNSSTHVCWDGVHFTEAAYKIMAHGLLKGTYAGPKFY